MKVKNLNNQNKRKDLHLLLIVIWETKTIQIHLFHNSINKVIINNKRINLLVKTKAEQVK